MRPQIIVCLLCLSLLAPILRAQQAGTAASANVNTTPAFVFEGEIDHVDPVLRDEIGPPRVLAGTMELGELSKLNSDPNNFGKYSSTVSLPTKIAITKAEFTLDRNYVISYEGFLTDGHTPLLNYVLITNGEAKNKDDVIYFSTQMQGEALKSGFRIQNLVITLFDDDGEMVDSTDPFYTAPAYKEASFELLFINPETGEEAKATGPITLFANLERDVTPQQDFQQLEEQIRELDEKLTAKEKLIADLQTRLGLQDQKLKARDEKIAALEAHNAELAKQAEQLRSGEAIQVMEKANAALLEKLEDSQEAREFSAASVAQMTVRQEFLAKDNAVLAKTNTELRDELASALAELGNMRNQQEMLARQANISFQQTLPPPPSHSSSLPLANVAPKNTRSSN
ncbi:hypothetical protein, partial [Cerasicoccus arenae]